MKTQINNTFSIGQQCNTDGLMKIMGMRGTSSPFSWMVVDIRSSLFFMENKFKNFTDAIKFQRKKHNYGIREHISSTGHSTGKLKRWSDHTIFINKTFNSLEEDNFSKWERICVWVHHDLEDKGTLEAFERRQSRLLKALKETPETTLLLYIERIQPYNAKETFYDINLINKFVQKYNCKFLLVFPLVGYEKDVDLVVDTDSVKIIYYKSRVWQNFVMRPSAQRRLQRMIKDRPTDEAVKTLASLQNKIFKLYEFK